MSAAVDPPHPPDADITVLGEPLAPGELFEKLDMVLSAAARYTRQMPMDRLKMFFRNRERTIADTCYHTFRVSLMGVDSLEGRGFTNAGLTELAPADWGFNQIADWGLGVRDHIRSWRKDNPQADLKNLVETYYGTRTLHDIMDRTTYHSAQHMRQLMLMLEEFGVTVDQPVTMEDLKGVPVPEAAWG